MGDEALKELLAELRRQIDISDILPVAVECWADALESALSELARLRGSLDWARYLAVAAEYYLNVMSDPDPRPDAKTDGYTALRSGVYEFRKRLPAPPNSDPVALHAAVHGQSLPESDPGETAGSLVQPHEEKQG